MGQPEQFSLKWGEFEETMSGGLRELRAAQQLEDVTLVVEGGELKAHRVVLASCSPFFRRIGKWPNLVKSRGQIVNQI